MKKIHLSILSLLVPFLLLGQGNTKAQLLSENFSGTSFPPSGWTIENHSSRWTKSNTSNAGGTSPELKFSYISSSLTTRFISPVLDASEAQILVFSFKHFVDHYGAGYKIGVATRSSGGAWNKVLEITPASNIREDRSIVISNSDVGSSSFQFCFYLEGNLYQINDWFIDDITLFIPLENDLLLKSIDIDKAIEHAVTDVDVVITNIGIESISSFTAHYQIDDGTPVSQTFTGLNLATGDLYPLVFDEKWVTSPGTYTLSVWVDNINGNGDDDDMTNNSLEKTISVASETVPNLPMFESFTSSTCSPCYSFNTSTFTPFLNSHSGQFAIVKYQMNWPGSGDPYYTAEGGIRRTYYGVNGVPMLFVGGLSTQTSAAGLNAAFDREINKPSFFKIEPYASIMGTTVNATISIMPYVTAENLKVHVAVVERETRNNVGGNGETSFKYVMMKMLPNATGTLVNFTAGEAYNLSFEQNLSGTHVEEFDDLMLVVFIQNDSNHEVMQSAMIDISEGNPVTFTVSDGSTPIEGATITVRGNTLTTNENGEASCLLPVGESSFTVTKRGYVKQTGTVTVGAGGANVDIIMEAATLYNVIFVVTDGQNPIAGATVSVAEEDFSTGGDGVAVVNLQDDDYTFEVTKTGYYDFSGSFTVNSAPEVVSVTMELIPTYTVTFTVVSGEEPIEAATISINDEELVTNAEGICHIELPSGTYSYTISAEGFWEISGEVIVGDDDESITVQLISTGIESFSLSAVTIYPNPTKGQFVITVPNVLGAASFKVFNVVGAMVSELYQNQFDGPIPMNISQPQGVYFVVITLDNGQSKTLKLVIE